MKPPDDFERYKPESERILTTAETGLDSFEVESAKGIYTDDQIARLILLSFRFSQGSEDLQEGILQHIAGNYRDKFSEIDPLPHSAVDRALSLAKRLVANSQTHAPVLLDEMKEGRTEEEIKILTEEEVTNEMEKRALTLNFYLTSDESVWSFSRLPTPQDKAQKMLWKEASFFIPQRFFTPRYNRPRETRLTSGPMGIYTSHFAFYGLAGNDDGKNPRGHETPMEEFNSFFADITAPSVLENLDDESRESLTKILSVHFRHNPDDVYLIPDKKRAVLATSLSEDIFEYN